jgi:hypothetical protein
MRAYYTFLSKSMMRFFRENEAGSRSSLTQILHLFAVEVQGGQAFLNRTENRVGNIFQRHSFFFNTPQ